MRAIVQKISLSDWFTGRDAVMQLSSIHLRELVKLTSQTEFDLVSHWFYANSSFQKPLRHSFSTVKAEQIGSKQTVAWLELLIGLFLAAWALPLRIALKVQRANCILGQSWTAHIPKNCVASDGPSTAYDVASNGPACQRARWRMAIWESAEEVLLARSGFMIVMGPANMQISK